MHPDAQALIAHFQMRPLPREGGYFAATYSDERRLTAKALGAPYTTDKPPSTAILYLLTPDTRSALHRLPTPEVYHYYLGDPVTMLQLADDGSSRLLTLGSDVLAGQCVQTVVPADVWQGSLLSAGGRYALLGTTMAPGYDDSDYVPGTPALLERFPQHRALIFRLLAQL